jgi:hypothetical protein
MGNHADGAIYQCAAPGPGESQIGLVGLEFWLATPPPGLGPSPEQLAEQALATLTIPPPKPARFPDQKLADGRPFTVVNAYTWYWTDPSAFHTMTATASAGGVTVTVTVMPSALTFSPGDGSATASCANPGVAWRAGDSATGPSPDGCDYQCRHSSVNDANGMLTATYGIDWSISWTSNVGDNSTLPGLTTTAQSTFAVIEVETVVTH